MSTSERLVQFCCPRCDELLKSPAENVGRGCRCPRCSILMEIPEQTRALAVKPVVSPSPVVRPAPKPVVSPLPVVRAAPKPVVSSPPVARPAPRPVVSSSPVARPTSKPDPAVPARRKQATVPLKIALPENLGGIETTVTQDTANDVAKVVTGGFLVVLGIAVAAFFGIRRPSV
jgi:hypothetical protein